MMEANHQPFLLVQLSDPHIGATWGVGDPLEGLRAAIDSVRRLPYATDVVLVSGDLADHGAEAEYERLRDVLSALDAPIYVLAGNHDDRYALRRHFDLPGAAAAPVQYATDLGPLRLVVLDTTRPGVDRGGLDEEQLAWLEAELAAAPDRLTLLALHHPPISTGSDAWDEICLPAADRHALADVVKRHPQVRRLVAGHVHRTIVGDLADRAVVVAPRTYMPARLTFGSDEIGFVPEGPGFALHSVVDGELASHVLPIG